MRAGTLPTVLATVLVIPMLAFPGRAEAQNRPETPRPVVHEVVISVDPSTGVLSYSLDPVEAIHRDRVVFSAPGVESWSVTFTGETPFENRVITGSGEQSRNVPILPTVAVGTYKYNVSVTVGGQTFTQDPEIIVRDRRAR